MKMKLLVLGGAGVTGKRVVEIALNKGMEVYATYRHTPPPKSLRDANWLKADVDEIDTIRKLLNELKPEAVIDMHAYNKVDDCEDVGREDCWRTNAMSPGLWARECSKKGIKYVWVSTDFVFDGENPPYAEGDVPRPLSQYAVSKLVGEQRALLEGAIVLRTAVVYDSDPRSKFLGWVIRRLAEGKEVPAFVDQWNNPTWAKALAQVSIEALRLEGPKLLHAVGKECMSRYEFAKAVARAMGYSENLVKPSCSCEIKQKARRPKRNCLLTEKLKEKLGVEIPSPREVIKEISKELKETYLSSNELS
ncbi:hypothetical protein IPA_05550 [Ignicoccus pacificus DSM 13166]|uniref:RmlD-like substrate binding domain-containing protein n=1 Tax=Ignicoccus pacificus DSM 13166 TaxID=940294 RepID=A0A977PLH2_9CREN|nr:hypothetical protein IPA_05550 [Ignicoccus pacificus DSM 13166]